MYTPLVSIIIPTFNRANLIGETLDSILAQTYENWECIVVDDGSTDGTEELLKRYVQNDSRFQYFKRPEDRVKGGNSCRNFGFEISKGEFVNWFDSDDLMIDKKIELQIAKLIGDSDKYMCVCQTLVFENTRNNILGLRNDKVFSEDPLNDFITSKIKWLTQSPIIRKDFLIDNNLKFDESLQQSQEWDFFVRVLDLNVNYTFMDEPLVLFRKHCNSISFGSRSLDKILSGYFARKKALKNTKSALSYDAKFKILGSFIATYNELLVRRYFSEANRIRKELLNNEYTCVVKLKINLAFISYLVFNKGHFFLKFKN